jgi:DNA helicase HerA-like ATPase
MTDTNQIFIGGANGEWVTMPARSGNRHGLIAGATGTGKTVTLQVLAESFSRLGVPVFMADVKGDLAGLARPGNPHPKIDERRKSIGMSAYQQRAYPVVFWDVFGVAGHPVRTTISEMGPLLLSSLLELNDTQEAVLYACFSLADDNGMLLLDLKDLRAMLSWMGDNARELKSEYGNITPTSIASIQRRLMVLEEQGADRFFGEPALKLDDLMMTDFSGNGVIGILDATRLMIQSPRLYATLLLWLLSELFEQLPEVGDPDRPRLVFFFDEAHLLFDTAPKPLLQKIEQVVRLIRSKGVGVYFITQNPTDIPDDVLGQLGLRVQHALRAFTPRDQKAVDAAAETFRPNPEIDTKTVITQLGVGEALVSVLDDKKAPTPVRRVLICPPESRIGVLTIDERTDHLSRSPMKNRYDEILDRESAYEMLKQRAEKVNREAETFEAEEREQKTARQPKSPGRTRQSVGEAIVKSMARSISSQIGNQIGRRVVRGILGSIFGGK